MKEGKGTNLALNVTNDSVGQSLNFLPTYSPVGRNVGTQFVTVQYNNYTAFSNATTKGKGIKKCGTEVRAINKRACSRISSLLKNQQIGN